MARIAGALIPNDKKVEYALPYVYGIGLTLSRKILAKTKIDGNVRVKDLSEDQLNQLRAEIEKNYKVEGELKRDILSNIKRLKDVKSYRGSRHAKNLPVNGQRTKTNSRTVRGNRRSTAGSGKVKLQKT